MLQSQLFKSLLLLLIMSFGVTEATALPLREDGTIAIPNGSEAKVQLRGFLPFSPNFTEQYDFEGIVSLSNCSGSLMRFTHSQEIDKALVLTNGHCIGAPQFLEPGEISYKQPSNREFGIFGKLNYQIGRVRATELVYATMTGTDIAIYRLEVSYADIKNRFQVSPLTLRPTTPPVGMPIEVISGYWKRGYTCQIKSIIHNLRESDWTFVNSLKYLQPGCETIGGTSGSPIIEFETRTIVGINNTGNESGGRCTMNNPCEVDESGNVVVDKGSAYGQQTYQIYSCLTESRELDLSIEGCTLEGANH